MSADDDGRGGTSDGATCDTSGGASEAGNGDGLTVVLGWDGLDYELAGAFDLHEAFGPHHARLETFDNPVLGEPHTKELWPSIVTGAEPDEHGIHAATDDGPDWADPRVATVARLARGVVPDRVRTEIGRLLRNQGATFAQKGPDHYREAGVGTVFDGRRARVIAVPNYRTDRDRDTDYVVDRGGQLSEFLSITESSDTNRPETTLPRLQERLVAETAKKLGAVRVALRREHDIVFVWLSVLDTVGHLAPVVADKDPSWQERSYRLAANATRAIHEDLQPGDTLVCVSDHGLRDGDHTHDAFIGATDGAAIEGVESVLGVREGLERVTPARGEATHGGAARGRTERADTAGDGPPVREAYRFGGRAREKDADEVRGQLEDLGYL